jgi:hypothetical protein
MNQIKKYEERRQGLVDLIMALSRVENKSTGSRYVWAVAIEKAWRKLDDCHTSFRGYGKYLGHPVWSKAALKLLTENGGICNKLVTDKLSHEHVVPLNYRIRAVFMGLPSTITAEEIGELIDFYGAVAIITKEEDKSLHRTKMPTGWDKTIDSTSNIYARYTAGGIFDNLEFN